MGKNQILRRKAAADLFAVMMENSLTFFYKMCKIFTKDSCEKVLDLMLKIGYDKNIEQMFAQDDLEEEYECK